MASNLSKIIDFMQLERIEENIFRGESQNLGTPQVFGGQVLGQALNAAQQTVDGRPAHSVHAYFLRRGDFNAPIVYQVDRSRDGGSFSARRVEAIQHGRPIFTLSASFQVPEEGLDHHDQRSLPPIPKQTSITEQHGPHPFRLAQDFDIFKVDSTNDDANKDTSYSMQWWLKTREPLPDDPAIHRTVLAFISDYGLLPTSLMPHGFDITDKSKWKDTVLASIDHTIWFHRPCRMDEWLFYDCKPISTSGGRGASHGSLYTQSGTLVATTFQEGLTRKVSP